MVTKLLEGSLSLLQKWIVSMFSSAYEINQRDLSGSGVALAIEIAVEPIPCNAFAVAEPRPGPKTILLVEDEAFLRQAITEALESAAYRVLVARSGNEALKAFAACPGSVDLLLTDLVMPGMGGRHLATEFERLSPHARILLMSGYADQLTRDERSHEGKNFLVKPFSVQTLLGKVRELLEANQFD
jgi:CheY-like chemotaxis protein